MPIWAVPLITQLAPIIFAMLAPIITSLVEVIGEKLGVPVPKAALPVVNHVAGAGLGVAAAGDSPMAPLAIPLGMIGAQLGNRVREALKKSASQTP